MMDGIIKADGTSRMVRAELPATYAEFRDLAAAGKLPLDIMVNEAGWAQLPTWLNKKNLLQDSTELALFGDASNRTIDEAFRAIARKLDLISSGVATMTTTVQTAAGNPLYYVLVQGMFNENGGAVYTDIHGVASGYVSEGTVTLSVSGYADLSSASTTLIANKGGSYTASLVVSVINFLKLTSTQNVKFSGNVGRVDVSVGGGGGGGGNGDVETREDGDAAGGGGGGGGRCTTMTNVSFAHNTTYTAAVGAGGSAGGANGGTSSFLGVTAAGGSGGRAGVANTSHNGGSVGGAGGSGNGSGGKGGAATRGSNAASSYENGTAGGSGTGTVYDSFTTTIPYGGGGGGGSANCWNEAYGSGGAGGSPAGAGGGKASTGGVGVNGQGGGGGGGSGYTHEEDDRIKGTGYKGGKGGDGVVAIRMHPNVA